MQQIQTVYNPKSEPRQKLVNTRLLLHDGIKPEELEGDCPVTPSKEIFQLMQDAVLERRNHIKRPDGSIQEYNGALVDLAARLEVSPTATAKTILALVGQFPWMKNATTKPLIRKALAILRAADQVARSKPAPAADIHIPIQTLAITEKIINGYRVPGEAPGTTVKVWPKVQAVALGQQIVAEFVNGLLVNWGAVALKKDGWKDEPVKTLDAAIERFEQMLTEPPPSVLARLQLVRQAIDAGEPVRLVVDKRLVRMAEAVAEAVKRLPPTPKPTPTVKGEYGVHHALHTKVVIRNEDDIEHLSVNIRTRAYDVRIGIDDDDHDWRDKEPLADPAPIRFRKWILDPATGLHKQAAPLLHKNRGVIPDKDQVCWVECTQKMKIIVNGKTAVTMTKPSRVLGIRAKAHDHISNEDYNVVYYMRPGIAFYEPQEDETGNVIKYNDSTIQMTSTKCQTAWNIVEGMTEEQWQKHPFFAIAAMLTARAEKDRQEALAQNFQRHEFQHRTRRADGSQHDETTNMRFDQHDEQIFQQGPLEMIEEKLAILDGDTIALDYLLADPDLNPETAAFLAAYNLNAPLDATHVPANETPEEAALRNADEEQQSRPVWWRKTVDSRKTPGRRFKMMEKGIVKNVVDNENHRYGRHVVVTTWDNKTAATTIYAHLESINVKIGDRLNTGDIIGVAEPPLLLPARYAAEHSMVRDCKIKRIGPDGKPVEGWVVPVNYQLADITRRVKVMHEGKVLPPAQQRQMNEGDCWEYIAVGAPNAAATTTRIELPPFNPNAIVRPPMHQRIVTSDRRCDLLTSIPAHRVFEPDHCWHEPLTDDDTMHLIRPVETTDSEYQLACLVADAIR